MNDFFGKSEPQEVPPPQSHQPLATRFRPRNLEEYVGQGHILGPGKLLRRAIESDRISSLILFGPPGTGKTSLAHVIAAATQSRFEILNAVEASVTDLRRVTASAKTRLAHGVRTILFIDEIHRFNKAQQDVLLPEVESGVLRLIGATTMNPFFYVNAPLVSRSQVFQLEPLSVEDLKRLLLSALQEPERGLGKLSVQMDLEALEHLAVQADGDARKALNALEIGVLTTPPDVDGQVKFTRSIAEESIQKKAVVYDADQDQHYDTISALIKSMRGSDPDAALYWLAKMLYAGEDIRFLARRIVICASEDVGMADPQALVVAVAAQQAVEFVGMPEARIPLAQATVYIATAPKSNASYKAIEAALEDVKQGVTLEVPKHLRDAHYPGSKRLGHGKDYAYSHDFEGGIAPQTYLSSPRTYYEPTERGFEKKVKERLEYWKSLRTRPLEASSNEAEAGGQK